MRIGIDMLGMQSPDHRGRGIGRCCTDLLRALFREASSYRLVLYRHDGLPTDGLPEGPNTSTRTLPRDPGGRTSSEALARIVATNPDGLDSLLILSPFEPSADYRIPDRPAHGLRLAAVVYDLIPLRHPARYLPNERLRRRYHATISALRRYDALLTISEWTRIDCLRLLGLPPHQMGNSALHRYIYDRLDRWPGLVTQHDFSLVGMQTWYGYRPYAPPDYFRRTFEDFVQLLPDDARPRWEEAVADPRGAPGFCVEQMLFLNRKVFDASLGVSVHSRWCQQQAERLYPERAGQVHVVSYGAKPEVYTLSAPGTRSPVSSRVQTASRSVGVLQALNERGNA